MAGDRTNPSLVGGDNEYYAERVGLSGPIGIVRSSDGLTVDRARYDNVAGTKTQLDKNSTQSKPLGQSR